MIYIIRTEGIRYGKGVIVEDSEVAAIESITRLLKNKDIKISIETKDIEMGGNDL